MAGPEDATDGGERLDRAVEELRAVLRSRDKRRFLRDIGGQIREDEDLFAIVGGSRSRARQVVVSFDRRHGHNGFSYGRFDLVLELLDMLAGGSGVSRPVSQLRALSWHGTRRELRRLLRRLARNNRELRFRRLLVMNFQQPPIGYRLYRK